jgi:FAD/FMN-containing dehydrogenase
VQFNFYFDPDDKSEREMIKAIYLDSSAALIEEKAYFNRPYPLIVDTVYRKHGEYAALMKRFKKHFDPNGILNPGNLCF